MKYPVTKHILNLNHSIIPIRLLKHVNNCKELGIREAIVRYKDKNNLFDWSLIPLQNTL